MIEIIVIVFETICEIMLNLIQTAIGLIIQERAINA